MDDSCIVVYTSRPIERMAMEGGSQAWSLNAPRARTYPFVVCAWNPAGPFAHANQGLERGEGFMVARVTAVEPAPEDPRRYILRFSDFARVRIPHVWTGQRNPVSYTSLAELGIDLDSLTFVRNQSSMEVPAPTLEPVTGARSTISADLWPLPISAAKPRLAAYYDVPVESIEIVIRG